MTDDILAWRVHPVVAPDGSSAIAELPFGSFLLEGVSGPLPDDLVLSVIQTASGLTPFLEFPGGVSERYVGRMRFVRRDNDQ